MKYVAQRIKFNLKRVDASKLSGILLQDDDDDYAVAVMSNELDLSNAIPGKVYDVHPSGDPVIWGIWKKTPEEAIRAFQELKELIPYSLGGKLFRTPVTHIHWIIKLRQQYDEKLPINDKCFIVEDSL